MAPFRLNSAPPSWDAYFLAAPLSSHNSVRAASKMDPQIFCPGCKPDCCNQHPTWRLSRFPGDPRLRSADRPRRGARQRAVRRRPRRLLGAAREGVLRRLAGQQVERGAGPLWRQRPTGVSKGAASASAAPTSASSARKPKKPRERRLEGRLKMSPRDFEPTGLPRTRRSG